MPKNAANKPGPKADNVKKQVKSRDGEKQEPAKKSAAAKKTSPKDKKAPKRMEKKSDRRTLEGVVS